MDPNDKPLILITGSSGLIGSRVQRQLAGTYRIVGLDLTPPETPVENARFFECDLTDDESVRTTLEQVREECGDRIASVIHLAAYYDFSGEASELYEKLTVEGTRRMLTHLAPFTVEQFVFSSSLLVMAPAEDDDQRLDEGKPIEAKWAYPESKIEAESLLLREHGDIPVVVLRLAGIYDADGHSPPICQHMRMIYEKKFESFVFPGDSDHGQSFLHLDDAAECIERVVEWRGSLEPAEVFLIGEPEVLSYAERQRLLGELIHGNEWPLFRIPKPVARAGAWVKDHLPNSDPFIKSWMIDLADDHYPVAIEKARRKLGWEPKHRLRDELPEMTARLLREPEGWYRENGLELPRNFQTASG